MTSIVMIETLAYKQYDVHKHIDFNYIVYTKTKYPSLPSDKMLVLGIQVVHGYKPSLKYYYTN